MGIIIDHMRKNAVTWCILNRLVFNMSPKKLEYVPKRKVRKCPQNKWKSEFVPKINNLNLSPNKFKFVWDLGWPYWPTDRVCVVPQRIVNMMDVQNESYKFLSYKILCYKILCYKILSYKILCYKICVTKFLCSKILSYKILCYKIFVLQNFCVTKFWVTKFCVTKLWITNLFFE